ncbi:hypothetical protein PGT21_033248 [Puccinia graminis f. sp. tritici]|uniref:General transcription and DNA repair factor IIH n=2 Tax=Puccinia graminis f. sp. tritici TaxID=56615 RepID=A0A5B0RXV0_PUCGR|nr:hypothetical protein PGT21_033248 [Puccinia graminis f. sp. tritici]KAA1130242.1 hypothetical protein PGTUg99_016766 [Puccinia graminis f. sp. tritici]
MARPEDTESEEDPDGDWEPGTTGRTGRAKGAQADRTKEAGAQKKHKKKATAYASKDGEGYSWEEEYKRSWDALREDESGSLESAVNQLIANKRRRVIRDTTSIQRGIIRHLCLIIDVSLAMTDRDLRPNRLDMSLTYAKEFVTEFFDQNPISQLCILITKDAIAERLSGLSGNPLDHHKALSNKAKLTPSGEPSLQNSLEMARASLSHLPSHGSREVLVIFGSLTTCDPDDINKTLENLEKDRMRVSMVGLAAEVRICKEICKRTQGQYGVILNEHHFKELLFEAISPPPIAKSTTNGPKTQSSSLIQMGFPNKITHDAHQVDASTHSFCACHSKLQSTGFICPRCGSKNCEIPTNCSVCGLTIVSSPHLARSYRHLFPVSNWIEKNANSLSHQTFKCFGCDKELQVNKASQTNDESNGNSNNATNANNPSINLYHCPRCKNMFCYECDIYHEQLGLCPGCC